MKTGIEFGEPRAHCRIEVVKPTLWQRIRGRIPVIWDFIVIWALLTGLMYFLVGCGGGGYYAVPRSGYYQPYQPAYVPQFYEPYNPVNSPVFHPVPITSGNPYGARR
jgi:hypothetical protein